MWCGGSTSSPTPLPPPTRSVRCARRWMDVSGPTPRVGTSSPIYPVFDALRGMGDTGRYTFPDQATGAQRNLIGRSQKWTPDHPVTLISTVGHLHPGGLETGLRVRRGANAEHAVHIQGPLLRAGRARCRGMCDGRDACELARQAAGGRHAERARDLRRGESGLVRGDGDHARGRLRRERRRRGGRVQQRDPHERSAHARAPGREPKPRRWPHGAEGRAGRCPAWRLWTRSGSTNTSTSRGT